MTRPASVFEPPTPGNRTAHVHAPACAPGEQLAAQPVTHLDWQLIGQVGVIAPPSISLHSSPGCLDRDDSDRGQETLQFRAD